MTDMKSLPKTVMPQAMVPAESLDAYMKGIVEIATAYLQNNRLAAEQVPGFLRGIGTELARVYNADTAPVDLRSIELQTHSLPSTLPASEKVETPEIAAEKEVVEVDRFAHLSRVPVVSIKKSVTKDAIICLFDGEKKQMLKRHIRARYGMEAEDYRRFWNLPADYPMVAPGYSQEKKDVAVAQGLGTAKVTKVPKAERVQEEKIAA